MDRSKIHKDHREDWETPDHIYKPLAALFDFTIDLAANKGNKKCRLYIGPTAKGIARRNLLEMHWAWFEAYISPIMSIRAWINPPYGKGNLGPFTTQIATLHAHGMNIAALLPASIETQWFHDNVLLHARLFTREGRIQFVDPPSLKRKTKSGNPGPSILAVYGFKRIKNSQLRKIGWYRL